MAWQKGQSGNPLGRRSEKLFREAMLLELAERGDGDLRTGLRKIASVVVDKALAGDSQAIRELADRLDGKPTQMLEHAAPEEGRRITKVIHEVVHVTETQEQIDKEIDGENLLVDYHEIEASNGHTEASNGGGSNGHDSNGSGGGNGGNGHSERVGRVRD